MNLFSGSSHPRLAASIASELGIELGGIECKQFSSGENYVRFTESIRGKEVFLVQTGTRDSNTNLLELFLMCNAAKLSFAKSIHVLIPYFPYARQDRVSQPREPISAKLVAGLLERSGADHVVTLDVHSEQIQGFFTIPVDSLDSRPLFAKAIKELKKKDVVIVSPDIGGTKRVKRFADLLDADMAVVQKNRPGHQSAEVLSIVGDVEGRTCILFDDIIDTGGSLVKAKEALVAAGAKPDVYAAATHPVLSGEAIENLQSANFAKIFVSNSIPVSKEATTDLPLEVLDIAPLLGKVLTRVTKGESVTTVYES